MAFFAGDKKYRSKADGWKEPRDLRLEERAAWRASKAGRSWKGQGSVRLEKNAARRAACQLRASKAGRSWKGGARERADGVFFAAGRKKTPEQSGRSPGREGTGNPRDLRLEKNAARRAACQLRASKAGRSWKGGARERADGVFFAAGRKKTPEQSGRPPGQEGTGNPRDSDWKRMPPAGRPANCEPAKRVAVGKEEQGSVRMASFFAAGRKKTPEQSGLCSDVVPKVGLEPTRYRYQRILSPSRLPFHHFGISTKLSIP